MLFIECRTNLDGAAGEDWPYSLPARPVKGDLIRSNMKWGSMSHQLELEVVQTTWVCKRNGGWILEVELHLPQTRAKQIEIQFGGDWRKFYEWFRRP